MKEYVKIKCLGKVVISFCLLFLASGLTEFSFAQDTLKGGTLTWGLSVDVQMMDPIRSVWMTDATKLIYERLVTINPETGEYVGELAKSWEVSEDGLIWTFHLKKGVHFHDGTPFNAQAAKWVYDKIIEKKPFISVELQSVKEILASDDYTLVFKLKNPDVNLLFGLSNVYTGIFSPAAYKKYGEDYGVKAVVGTGPFKFKEWIPGEKLVIVRNEDYQWPPSFIKNPGPPYLEKIVYKFKPEAATRVMELEAGNFDILEGVPYADVKRLENRQDIKIFTKLRWSVVYLGFNLENKLLKDLRIRKAISYGISRKPYVNIVLRGYGWPAYTMLPFPLKANHPQAKKMRAKNNPQKAKELLAEAGWIDSDGDGIVDKNGKPLRFKLVTTTTTEFKQVAEIFQAQMKQVGIDIKVEAYDVPTQERFLTEGKYDICTQVYVWNNADIINFLWNSANIPMPNFIRLKDKNIDDLLLATTKSASFKERNGYFQKLQRYAIPLAITVPLYTPQDVFAVNKRVKGFKPPKWGLYPYMNDVYIEK